MYKKGMVLAVICLFLGAGVLPSISGNVEFANKEFYEKNIHTANNDGPSVDSWYIVDSVGLWHFNEGVGDVALDSSDYGNHGGIHGAEWTTDTPPGGTPYALHFYADANSYVGVSDDSSLDFDDLGENEGFMIDFWMKKNQTPSPHYAGLVSKAYQGGYYVILGTDNKIGFTIINSGNTQAEGVRSNKLIEDKNWHHIVAVWDGDTMYLYIDDMENPDNTNYVGDFKMGEAGNNKWLDIGNDWPTDRENPFDGMIDEVQISIIKEDVTPPECSIEKPRERYRYLNNRQIGEYRSIFGWTLVIGPRIGIMAEAKAKDEQSGIDKVKFYINDEYYGEDIEPNPSTNYYEYGWVETRFGKCTLEAIAWDKAGHSTSSGIIHVWYFNIE